jgi:hypothetical protein
MSDEPINQPDAAFLLVPLPAAESPVGTAMNAVVPTLIMSAGDQATWRYIEFFTANIRNPNTRRAYGRACQTFFAWCKTREAVLATIRPYDVATY